MNVSRDSRNPQVGQKICTVIAVTTMLSLTPQDCSLDFRQGFCNATNKLKSIRSFSSYLRNSNQPIRNQDSSPVAAEKGEKNA